MGKTLTSVLTVAAIATLTVVAVGTGVGVAAGVPLLASLEASIAGLGLIAGVSAATAGTLTLAAASIVASDLLAPKLPKPDTTATALKTALPPRIRAYGETRLYGSYVLYVTSPNGVAIDIYSVCDTRGFPIEGIKKLYLGDQLVGTTAGVVAGLADGTYGDGAVSIDFRLGNATETAFSQAVTELPGVWTSDHRGDGVVTGMVAFQPVKAKDYQKVYPNGQPALSMVARWLKVFDWRDEAQAVDDPATWKWTENAVLHLADYILTVEKPARSPSEMFPSPESLQRTWDRYFAPTLAYWTAAADDCDAPRALKSGGTEPRYRSLVAHKLTDAHKDVKTRLTTCFDGWLAPREDGALVVYSGRYYPPTVRIGPDETVTYSLQEGVEDERAVNDITVTYVSAEHDFNTVDTDNWTDEADIAQRGALRSESFSPDVPSYVQARALAKRKLIQAMAPARGTVTTNSGGRIARGERFVWLDLVESGAVFFSGPVEITQLTRNLATGGVTFTWIAATPAIDEWIPAIEEGNPAPVGDAVPITDLTAPTINSATAQFSNVGQNPDGEDEIGDPVPGETVKGARVLITATGPDRADLTWYARWRVGTSSAWNEREYADNDPGAGVSILTEFVPLASNVNVQVSYSVGDGRASAWSSSSVVNTTP